MDGDRLYLIEKNGLAGTKKRWWYVDVVRMKEGTGVTLIILVPNVEVLRS